VPGERAGAALGAALPAHARVSAARARIQGARESRGGLPFEALTSPALLSRRERREKDIEDGSLFLVPLSPLGREGLGE
jgi:hypothetical protein